MKYRKTYAVIEARDEANYRVRVREEAVPQNTRWIDLRWRNGRGSHAEFTPGVRIKLYWRPGTAHPNFRRVGR